MSPLKDDELYFWVKSLRELSGGYLPLGLHFQDDGFRQLDVSVLERGMLTISEHGTSRLSASGEIVHIIHNGWFLQLIGETIPALPCMLTTDRSIDMVYNGPAAVRCDAIAELAEFVKDGFPLVGVDWFGVVRQRGDDFALTAFSSANWMPRASMESFYPDWFDNLEETPVDSRFVICPLG